jgi:hypothetical protein
VQPDPEKASRDEAAEKEILKQVKTSMTQEDLAELARATKELKDKQETPDPPEALKAVPSLSLKDIPKKSMHVPIEVIPRLTTLPYLDGLQISLPQSIRPGWLRILVHVELQKRTEYTSIHLWIVVICFPSPDRGRN